MMEETSKHLSSVIVKTVPIIRDLALNPSCNHGPTILFERDGQRFFACSAYRCRKLCSFYLPEEKWKVVEDKKKGKMGGNDKIATSRKRCLEGEDLGEAKLKKTEGHKSNFDSPLNVPNQKDKGEAQYHFNDATVNFFLEQLKNLGIDSVLCVGTPSLHEHLSKVTVKGRGKKKLNSFLLDIDSRFNKLYSDGFCLYNMCNHHFFQDNSKYLKFITNSKKLAVIADPPFGVKAELIWNGCFMGVQRDLEQFQSNSDLDPIQSSMRFEAFWIFPYFNEGHILKCSESKLQMSDFHVEYRNHAKYNGSSTKSKSSPIRVFTTVPLSALNLPENHYRYCDICTKWVDKQNKHCGPCGTCTTKDGGRTYQHCERCQKCVKPTWKHCSKCATCHLADSLCRTSEQGQVSSNPKKGNKTIKTSSLNMAKFKSKHNSRIIKKKHKRKNKK